MHRDGLSQGGDAPFPLTVRAGMRFRAVKQIARQHMTGHLHLLQLARNSGIIPLVSEGMQVEQKDGRGNPTAS